MIEMQDADRLAEGVDDVVVAIGIKTVAAIVAGGGDADAAPEHFLDHGHAAPAWGASRLAVLQIHIDRRQRDNGDFSRCQKVERAVDLAFRLIGQAATMPAYDPSLIAMPHRGA